MNSRVSFLKAAHHRAGVVALLLAGLVHGSAEAQAQNLAPPQTQAPVVSAPQAAAAASVGMARIEPGGSSGSSAPDQPPITVFYPSSSPARAVQRGPYMLDVAEQGEPVRGNGRLIVVSHGTGGSVVVHSDLARRLVEAGFVVAVPLHRADNFEDHSDNIGALVRRPVELSRTIDAVGRDARFAPLLALDKVGVYGMSAGGHTALVMAGGRWAQTGFRDHCEANIADDFQFCVGVITRLTGSWFDGVRKWAARGAIRWLFDDPAVHAHADPRVAAVVAAVPAAAHFDMASLAAPRVPLGLVTARQDRWLVPRFHSDRVLQACTPCERVDDIADGGHGAPLSPLPPGLTGILGDMLNDPPGFDRGQMAAVDRKTAAFFGRHLLGSDGSRVGASDSAQAPAH
jgi:predicted dienelactone hydrolase